MSDQIIKKYGKRRNKDIDDPLLYDGTKSQGLGNKSAKSVNDKNKKEREMIVKAMQTTIPEGPVEKARKEVGIPTITAKQPLSLRATINSKIEESMFKNIHIVDAAVTNYFEELEKEDGDKAVKKHFMDTFLNAEALKEMEKSQAKMLAENIDFQQFRVFKRGHTFQQRMMMAKETVTMAMAGRRAGKTEGNILKVGYRIQIPNSFVQIIGLTHETCVQLYWHPILQLIEDLGVIITEKRAQDGVIRLANGSMIQLMGNSTGDEREKMRGKKWHLVIVDEVQSQKALGYLISDIIEPTLLDYKGQLILTGTGPRIRGTLWEKMWVESKHALKLNWNLTNNPYIPDHEKVLEDIKKKKGLTDNDPLFVREYLGQIAYDDDALVLRFKEDNYYTPDEFTQWVQSQPPTDIHITGGLDYGFTDSDAFILFAWSDSSPMVFALYQYKMARQGINDLAKGIRDGIDYLHTLPALASIPSETKNMLYIFGDTSDNRASADLSAMLGLNIFPAYKHDKTAAIDFLQDDCRRGWLRIPKMPNGDMTPLEDEAMKTVFARDENDNMTREIDDDAYHPDMMPAAMYALRSGPWAFRDSR